jgi:hypothetical protein
LSFEHRDKVYASGFECVGDAFDRRASLCRSAVTDENAQIDGFGSHRRIEIKWERRNFLVAFGGRVHRHFSNRF